MRISNRKFFGLHPKVKLPQPFYASIFVIITLVGPTKVSIMTLKCTGLSRMWQHDFMMKQLFFSSIFFCLKTQASWLSRLATWPTQSQGCKTFVQRTNFGARMLFHSSLNPSELAYMHWNFMLSQQNAFFRRKLSHLHSRHISDLLSGARERKMRLK